MADEDAADAAAVRADGDATKSDVGDGYSTDPDRATGTDQNLATGEGMSS